MAFKTREDSMNELRVKNLDVAEALYLELLAIEDATKAVAAATQGKVKFTGVTWKIVGYTLIWIAEHPGEKPPWLTTPEDVAAAAAVEHDEDVEWLKSIGVNV